MVVPLQAEAHIAYEKLKQLQALWESQHNHADRNNGPGKLKEFTLVGQGPPQLGTSMKEELTVSVSYNLLFRICTSQPVQ